MKETQQQQNNLLCTGYSVFLFASLFIWLQRMRRNCRNLNIENNENHLCLSVRTKTINIYLRLPIISCPFRSGLCLGFLCIVYYSNVQQNHTFSILFALVFLFLILSPNTKCKEFFCLLVHGFFSENLRDKLISVICHFQKKHLLFIKLS